MWRCVTDVACRVNVIEMDQLIEQAVQELKRGGLVAFPTETVYGLGADARNADAVAKIFAAKGRPATNPVIVHVSGVAMAKVYAQRWPDTARLLAQRFWPGPLTLVVPKAPVIAANVTAGLANVAIRMPNHPLALELIHRFDGPVAAPSANRSMHISPTTADHVREELGDAVGVVLDGGPCTVGIESTVLDVSGPRPMILRPGGISREQIETVVGPVEVFHASVSLSQAASSPGQQKIHYAPNTPAYRFEMGSLPRPLEDARYGWLFVGGKADVSASVMNMNADRVVILPDDPKVCAQQLYSSLRRLDHQGYEAIYVRMPPDEPRWMAVRDRLGRAAQAIG